MPTLRCPGQDMRYWIPADIFDVACPYCGTEIEFWKDEPVRLCPSCGVEVRNPRIDLGCAKWCKFAEACLGRNVEHLTAAAPVIERLRADLAKALTAAPDRLAFAEEVHQLADTLGAADHDADPRVVKCAALLAGLGDTAIPPVSDLLGQAGLDAETSNRVAEVVRLAQLPEFPEDSEAQIVHDALRIATAQRTPPADRDAFLAQLCLDHARLLARHRLG